MDGSILEEDHTQDYNFEVALHDYDKMPSEGSGQSPSQPSPTHMKQVLLYMNKLACTRKTQSYIID